MTGLLHAFRRLTVLPVPSDDAPPNAWTAGFFPVVGFFLGLGWVLAAGSLRLFPRTTAVAAAVVLIVDAALTGARHLRGVADVADGLVEASTGEPPSLGLAGVVTVNLALLARFGILIVGVEFGARLLVIPIIGRAALLVLVAQLRGGVLGVPAPSAPALVGGLALAAAGTWLGGPRALLALAVALVVAVLLGLAATGTRRAGRVGGDGLAWGGALVAETVALLVLVMPAV
jgi:adenosylcobinamide-GDP ribazoletransferase